jgi:hypothetical protein
MVRRLEDGERKITEENSRNWIAHHPNVSRYAIIDDEDDELDELPLFQPSCKIGITVEIIDDEDDELDELPLFQPSYKIGITVEIVKGVEKYLSGKTDRTMRASGIVRLGQNIHSLFKRDKS